MWRLRSRSDEDFREEIQAHLEIETETLISEGMSPDEARDAAARRFGNATIARERFYHSRRVMWLDETRQDVWYALRAFRRNPSFTAVAVLTLAIGIGVNTAIFSVVNAVLLRPLPYHDPSSLVAVQMAPLSLSPDWLTTAYRQRAHTLAEIAGFNGPTAGTLIINGEPAQVTSAQVTPNFFSFLGVVPALGRDFVATDALPGAPPVAVLGHDVWMGRFGGDRSVVGRTITLNRQAVTVVGILAPEFRFPTGGVLPASGLPVVLQPGIVRVAGPNTWVNLLGRLSRGATPAMASAELLAILKQEGPRVLRASALERAVVTTTPLHENLVGDVRPRLLVVMGAVAFVLLVACANVANLLLARSSARQREMAVRAALGADAVRLARLMLTESVLLALFGSAGALGLATLMRGVVQLVLADRIPFIDAVSVDWWVLAFNLAVATVIGLLSGLASLPGVMRVNLVAAFSDTRLPSLNTRTTIRRSLLSVELATTFVLVVGAALLVQTFWNLSVKPRGFHAERLLTLRAAPGLPSSLDRSDPTAGPKYYANFFEDLTGRLSRLPGIESAAAAANLPLAGAGGASLGNVAVEGQPPADPGSARPSVTTVSPRYFRTMGIALISGRDFDEHDGLGAPRVAIVNRAFQRRFASDSSVTGRQATLGDSQLRIVGVVDDVPDRSLRHASEPLVFTPLAQMPAGRIAWGQLKLVLRCHGQPRAVVPAVRSVIWGLDRTIVIDEVATMEERVGASVRRERDAALIFSSFAVIALVMAAIGVYGVAAFSVARRRKEIGIRVALGAASGDVTRLVVWQTMTPAVIGLGAGLCVATFATRAVRSMIYGVTPLDPGILALAGGILIAVALAASWVPARRASRIDPIATLRCE